MLQSQEHKLCWLWWEILTFFVKIDTGTGKKINSTVLLVEQWQTSGEVIPAVKHTVTSQTLISLFLIWDIPLPSPPLPSLSFPFFIFSPLQRYVNKIIANSSPLPQPTRRQRPAPGTINHSQLQLSSPKPLF